MKFNYESADFYTPFYAADGREFFRNESKITRKRLKNLERVEKWKKSDPPGPSIFQLLRDVLKGTLFG